MPKSLARLAVALLWLAASGATALAQTVTGDWHATLSPTPAVTLRLSLHIERTSSGGYTGSLVSLDQSPKPMSLADIAATGDELSFKLPVAPPGSFTGKWDAKSGAWVGEWTQGGLSSPLTLLSGPPDKNPVVAGLDGAWDGKLNLPTGVALHLVLRVRTGDAGTSATIDSIDQLAYGLSVSSIHRDGQSVGFEMSALGADFAGTLSADGKTIDGRWTQGGRTTPLSFTLRPPGEANAAPKRPQTPTKPYPYREEDVTFDDAAAGVKLAGTLTLPQGAGPFPAVVLVAGSGPNTRNEPLLGHQVFLVLADHLTRNGIAVLRYDKRGVGQSTGDYAKATTADFADDTEAAAAYLRSRPEIAARRVGLIGHSEGGEIVPMVAARDPDIAFIVMMAGPGVDGAAVLEEQARLIAKAMGMDDGKVAQSAAFQRQLIDIVRQAPDPASATPKLELAVSQFATAQGVPASSLEPQATAINTPWFRFFFNYDPAPTLAKVRCPVLALNGSLDLQVPPDQNLPPIRKALAGNPDAEVDELPGLNHLFQDAKTGAPGEYGQIEETSLQRRWT